MCMCFFVRVSVCACASTCVRLCVCVCVCVSMGTRCGCVGVCSHVMCAYVYGRCVSPYSPPAAGGPWGHPRPQLVVMLYLWIFCFIRLYQYILLRLNVVFRFIARPCLARFIELYFSLVSYTYLHPADRGMKSCPLTNLAARLTYQEFIECSMVA